MVAQLVVQVDVAAAGRVKTRQQLAHHNQQLQVGGLFDEAALHLVFVLLGRLVFGQHMLGVGVKLVALVALGGFARNGVVVWLVRGDDAAVVAKARVLEQAQIVASVVNGCRHQNGRAPVVVQAWLHAKVVNDVGHDAPLALARAHQLFHRRPMAAQL